MRFALLFLSILAATACRSNGNACVRPTVDASSWRVDGGSAFKLRIASGFRRTASTGLDSEGGGWIGPSSSLWYDYGLYSARFDDSISTSGTVCSATIGGRRARVVLFRDSTGGYQVGANVPRFHWPGTSSVSLSIGGRAGTAAGRDSLFASIWSVTF
jgi:hypothetical protein